MQNNDINRRKKFYDQMSEAYDLGTFDEFNAKMDNAESREKLYKAIDADGKYDIGSFDHFDQAMKPKEVEQPQTNVATAQAHPTDTTTVQQAVVAPAAMPEKDFGFTAESTSPLQPEKQEPYKMPLMFKPEQSADNRQWAAAQASAEQNMANPVGPNAAGNTFQSMQQAGEAETARLQSRSQFDSKNFEQFYNEHVAPTFSQEKALSERKADEAVRDAQGSYMPGAGTGFAEGFHMAVAAEKNLDPEQVANNTIKRVQNDSSFGDYILGRMGINNAAPSDNNSPQLSEREQEWMNRLFAKETEEVANQITNRIYSQYQQENAPKSTLEYIAGKAFHENLASSLYKAMVRRAAGSSAIREQLRAMAYDEFGKDQSWMTRVAGGAAPFAVDMLSGGFALPNFVGQATIKGGTKLAARELTKRMSSRAAARGLEGAALKEATSGAAGVAERYIATQAPIMNLALQTMGSAANFATYETQAEAVRQIAEGKFKPIDLIKEAVHGAMLGTAMGAADGIIGNLAKNASTLGKIGAGAAGIGAETGIFALDAGLQKAQADGVDIQDVDWADTAGEAFGTVIGMKGVGAVMHPRNFLNRYRKSKDYNLQLNQGDLNELKQAGYNLDDVFKGLGTFGDVTPMQGNTISKAKEITIGNYGKQHEVEDAWVDADNYEAIMRNPEISTSAKRKIAYIATGKILTPEPMFGVTMNVDENGKATVTTLNAKGDIIETKEYNNEQEAQDAYAELQQASRTNTIGGLERIADKSGHPEVVDVAKGRTKDETGIDIDNLEQMAELKDEDVNKVIDAYIKNLQDAYMERFNENLERLGEAAKSASLGTESSGIETQSGTSGTQGSTSETEGETPMQRSDRREAAYQRGASVVDDESSLQSIGHDQRVAEARLMQQMPDGSNTEAIRKNIMQAVEANDLDAAEQLFDKAKSFLNNTQRDALEQYLDAASTQSGIDDAIVQQAADYEEQTRQKLQSIADEQGNITELQLRDGSTVYLVKGDLNNHYSAMIVTDGNGNNSQHLVSEVVQAGQTRSLDDVLAEQVNNFAEGIQQMYSEYANYGMFRNGQQVNMILSGQPVSAVMSGYDPFGNAVFTMEDGSQIALRPEEAQQAMMEADNASIQQQLAQEAESAKLTEQQERFGKGIKGYNEGQPDLTAAETDSKAAAEYLTMQANGDERVRKQQISDIENTKEQLTIRREEANRELNSINQWINGNEGIADAQEMEDAMQKRNELDATIKDIDQRLMKYGEIRRNLMTKEELASMEQQRRKEIFNARTGYQPQVPQRETRTNQDGITEEDGVPNFGLTSVGNANNYLLRNYPDSYDAEQFITNERLKLRNKQRDEVQPEMNKRNDILKAYADGTIDLSPDEVKQLVHEVADLEAQQNVLAQQAVRLREIADGIQALYERNGRTEDLTPAELRAKELDKAGSKEDKLRIARTLYKDYPEALDRINDQDPRDLDEFIAANLSLGSMNWEGINQGERHLLGVQEAVFGKRGATRGIGKGYTTNAFNHYLAPTGEGKDFNTIVHGIYEALPDVGDAKQWTTEDISNALINMLLTAQKPSDISHRIIDNRIAEAEEIVQHEEEYEREMEEMAKLEEMQAWADAYHLTPEERDEFEEFMKMAPTEPEIDIINNILENEQDSRSNELDNQPINNGVGTEIEGGRGEILGQGEEQIGSNQGEQRPVAGGEAGAADEAPTGDNVSGEAQPDKRGVNNPQSGFNIQGLDGYSEKDVSDIVKNHFNSLVGKDGIEIVDMKIIGSRVNGNANEDSDLDVLLEYKGDIKEDSLFNILNDEEDRLYIEGIPVDINPIRKNDSGTIEEFLKRNADYDTDRDKRNVTFAARLAKAIAETNTNPTEAQKEAGNYRKPKLKFGGYTFRIENPKGSIRSGVDRDGREWSQEMHDTYGYIEEKVGKDGDKMDFFINDDANLDTWDGRVYVVDQKNEDGTFDEHKVMYGYPNLRSAREAYKRNYEDGWYDKHVMKITGVRKAEFDKWLADSDHKIKPFSEYYRTKMLKDVVDDDFDQLISDVKERLQQIPEMDSQYTDEQISKMDINTLSQLIKKSQADGSTSRYLLANTKLDPASEKADMLRRNIAQSEADVKKLSAALNNLKKEFKLRAENAEAGGAIIDHLQDMGIDVTADTTANRKVYKQAEKDNSQEGKLHHMRTPDGTIYGFTYRGKIYLDPRKMDANRPLHEYGHLWADAFRRLNPEGWKDVVSVMKQDADTWQFVKSINPDLQSDSDIAEEMIAKGSGEKGEERVRAEFERMAQRDPSYKGKWNNIWKNISKAIQDFWKQIGDFLGIKYKTPAQVYDQVLKDFANGVNPRKKVEEYLKQRDAEYAEAVKSGNTSRATQIFNEALKENVGNGMTPYVAVDKYRKMQSLAHKIKDGDAEGIRKAAQLMSELIPENAVLIPTPSHKGKATTMLQLAEAIAERTGSEVADILESSPRASQYTAKKQGGKAIAAKDMGIKVNGQLPEGKVPVIIDNVVDTGNTAEACVQALGTGIVASLADSTEFGKRVATLRSAAPIIANKQGEIVPLSERFDLSRRETARPVADVTTLMDDVEHRNETARNEQQLQAAILSDKEAQEYDKRSSKVRQRATDAVLTALDDAKVPVRKVSRKEADQMMRLFTSMNIQVITEMARSMQPNSHRRYAVIDVRDPFSVPKYFEKRSYANEFKIWANNSDRLYELIDLGRNDANKDAALRDAADIMPEIQTWHGSGAVFTKFDHSHMSEGAGSQAFGWGTYLSDSKRIGEDYASMVNKGWAYQGKYRDDIKPIYDGKNHKSGVVRDILSGMNHGYTLDEEKEKVIRFVESSIRDYEDEINYLSEADKEDLKDLREILDFVKAIKPQDFKKSPENLYRVEIPEDNGTNYLEYKKPVGEKLAKEIRDFLYNHVMDSADKGVYKNMDKDVIRQDIDRVIEPESNMPWLQRALDARGVTLEEFSKWLSQKGYVGIKYPAGTIYGGGDGATNYVIFNEDDTKIVEHIQFMVENPESAPVFYSNALKAVEAIKQEKATPDQWLAMIQKNGGLKAGEDKWIGLSDWLEKKKESGKSVTKQELMDYVRQNQIEVNEQPYSEYIDVDSNPKMQQFRDEFNAIKLSTEGEQSDLEVELDKFEDAMYKKYGYGWHNKLNDEELTYAEKFDDLDSTSGTADEKAFDEMVNRYGDDFSMAFEVDGNGRLVPIYDLESDGLSDAAKYYLEMDELPINNTRLHYTSNVTNKKEIALTVPTIEPYNEDDQIHFGDAGEGRAVAWVRFGDTEISDAEAKETFKKAEQALYDFLDRMEEKYGGNPDDPDTYWDQLTPEEQAEHKKIMETIRETESAFDATKKKVLVIDEIQSKRHQDAREDGYRKELPPYTEDMLSVTLNDEGDWEIGEDIGNGNVRSLSYYPSKSMSKEQAIETFIKSHDRVDPGVPDAPFEKNWHELAMKRMLRYAAENGYDKVAWTTGAQQAERYDIGKVIASIERTRTFDDGNVRYDLYPHNNWGISLFVKDGVVTSSSQDKLVGKSLSDVVGKDLATKMEGMKDEDNISAHDFLLGGEGMKGFYDEILPRFMNKYGKKWGVKVDDVELPELEESARVMHSIDVTPEMKESVMQGQPMFQKSRGGRVYGWTDGTGIFLTPDGLNPHTPIHEYTHIWDAYVQKHDPELWKEMVSVFKQTDMWQQIRENPNYRAIWDDDNRMASEVHSRLSGQSGEQKFTEAAQDETKDSRGVINKVKNVLKKFWESIAKLFGYGKKATDRLAEFVNMPLRDLLTKKFNPIEGGATSAIPMSGETIEKTLMGVHNISEEKLKKALKLGGLANPSMAVIDTKNGIHTDYGEISLIPRSSLIDAKTGRNAGTYAGDAWTPTYPSVTKEMTSKGEKHKNQIAKEAAGGNEELEQHLARTMERYVGDNENRLHLLYLLQKGIKPDLIPESTIHTHDEYEALRKILGNDQLRYSSDGLTKEQNDAILDLMMKGVREKAEESSKLIKDEEKRQKAVETIVKMRKDSLVDPETGEIWFAKYDTYIYDVLRDEKRRQNPKIDWYKTDNEASYRVAKENLAEDYEAWKEQLFGDEDIAEKLFAGWTPDGYKKYVKNTVANASRLMNKEKDTNAYGNGGLSASKAMLVKKLKSLAEIRKYRHLIKKGDDIKEQLKQKESEWFDIIEQVSQMQKVDSNPFINNDIAEARLQEAMEQRDPIAYMNKEYGYHIDKDGELASQLMNFMEEASQIPVKYFETKFKRPVGIEEFAIAVVPTNTSPEVIKALEDKGLEVHTYEKGSHGDENDENRKAAVLNAVYGRNDILFHTDMAGESSVKSWRQTELFSDDDFLPEPKGKKSNRIKDMSDEELLKAIADKDGAERRTFIDIFDQRHIQEHEDAYNGYLDILNFSESSLEDAYQMYDNVWKEWKDGGYATSDRTRLLAQIDALEDFIQNKEEEQRELELERQEEEEAAQLQKEQEQFEKQKEEVRQTGYDLTQIRFRALEPGETCHVERRYTENKMFSFTGTDHIESIDDVAYIFRQLENKSVENTFVVLEKDGVPTIIHLAIGDFTSSQAPIMNVFAAYNELNPEHVWFVHNHPSGRIEASRQDKELMLSLRRVFGDKLLNGIIINTTSGKYGVFNELAQIGNRERPTSAKNETPIKVYSFDQQVFDKDWNPETAFDSLTPTSIAKFISSHRLGEHKKMSLLVMDTAGHITGNIFLPWTNLKDAAKPANAMQIATYVIQMGGGRCVIYGNYDVKNESNENSAAVRLMNMLKNHRVTLMDMIHMGANDTHYNSMHEKGVMEPDADNLYRKVTPAIMDVNEKFNKELEKLSNKSILNLGNPSANLIAAGIENMPLRLRGTKLLAKMNKHNYKAEDIKDLPLAVHNPIFVFKGSTPDSFAIITEISIDNKNVLVAVKAGKDVDIDFNVVSSVYGKRDDSIHRWINENKLLYADKEKAIEYLYNPAPNAEIADSTALDSAAKIVNDFENPSISEENLRNIYAKEVRIAEETADMLGGEKIIFEAEANENGALGWYDPQDGSIHVVLPAHADAEDVQRTVCHEKLGHEGLVALLGSQKEVDKFGHFVLRSADSDLKKRIIAKADEIDPEWKDPLRYSHAAQEVIADISADGPRTADEFSLWRKIKHYLIRFLNKLGLRIRGLLNDHDLSYYILKTGEALKKWNGMTDAQKREAAQQGYDAMYNRGKGKPRKRNNESMAQYLQRLREWERWKIAEQQARDNNDPMPTIDEVNAKWEEKYNNDLAEWKQRNNITGNMEAVGEFPKRKPNETPQEYAMRVADYETQKDIWREAPSLFDYLNQANREYRDAYRAWRERYGIREAENVDLGLYEGDPDSMPHIVDPEDLEAENRADAELAEAVGIDMSSEGAKRHTKLAVIERRKNLESANAEDAIWIHNLVKRLDEEAKRQGVSAKELRKNMADIIEGTYFEDVLRDENGNVVTIVDISDKLPIKMTDSLKEILSDIKDWYDYFYHQLEDAGLRGEAGYVEEGYVNHVWSREKSNPSAWEKYIENFQRTKSPNMRERIFQDYRSGEEVGLVRKFDDIAQIIAYYSSSNNQAIANKKFLDALSFVVVEETNSDGEVTQVLPLLNSQKPDAFTADRYDIYKVPGVGDVWVIKDIQRTFSNVFGTMRTKDVADWVSKFGRTYDIVSSTAKKIQLSFSAFHMGALTEVAMAQMRPDRAARALAQYIIFDCAKKGTIPAYAHPEDFKFAASHLVQLGATQDYSAADVNNLTEKFRDVVRELANDENLAKKGTGYAVTPVAAALDYINKGMDKVLWNYLHDGLKIACFKMFAEQIEKRVVKEALTPEQREQLLDEAGQYVNDTFGGQYWELLNVSPSTVKWLRRAFLSPDWLISTQRHFLANFGFGSLYSESGFLNYLRYNADNIKRVFGVDVPKDENRRFRSSNAKKCYILGVCGFFYIMMNALNAFFRAQDEEKEKAKADEIRKTNPDYKSGYELAYPDGMKWYDYTMYGNTVGQQTHLFLGRYDDGTEWYARWGKQFREFPELFMGRHGVEFPTPLMERMSGKANPVGRYLLYDLPLTVGMYGYRQPRETQEIADKYGNTVALLAMTAKKFLPFSVPTQEDKEFKLFDLVMPSQKGFTQWKAKDYFETYIEAGDMDGIQRTYNAAVMNGLDAEKSLKGAIASVKATQRKELSDGVDDLQTAMERFDAAKDTNERKLMKNKILKYLAEQNYKAFTRDEAKEQVESFLNGDQPTETDNTKYLELQTSADVRNDYRISALKKKAKKYVDEIMEADGDKQKALIKGYRHWFQVQSIIRESDKATNQLKKQLGKGKDDAAIMQQIRDIKLQTQKKIDAVSPK